MKPPDPLQWKSKHFCSGRANTLAVEEQTRPRLRPGAGSAPPPHYLPPMPHEKKKRNKEKKKTARIPINDIYQNERRYIPHGLKPDPRRLGDLGEPLAGVPLKGAQLELGVLALIPQPAARGHACGLLWHACGLFYTCRVRLKVCGTLEYSPSSSSSPKPETLNPKP